MRTRKLIATIVAFAYMAHATPSLAIDQGAGTAAKEYFTTNLDKRLLIRVQVWGSLPLTGVYYVPDSTNLVDLISYAGGPTGRLERAKILVKRQGSTLATTWETTGAELLADNAATQFIIENGDVVYVDIEKDDDGFMRNLTVVSTITGLVSSLLAVYLLANSVSK